MFASASSALSGVWPRTTPTYVGHAVDAALSIAMHVLRVDAKAVSSPWWSNTASMGHVTNCKLVNASLGGLALRVLTMAVFVRTSIVVAIMLTKTMAVAFVLTETIAIATMLTKTIAVVTMLTKTKVMRRRR